MDGQPDSSWQYCPVPRCNCYCSCFSGLLPPAEELQTPAVMLNSGKHILKLRIGSGKSTSCASNPALPQAVSNGALGFPRPYQLTRRSQPVAPSQLTNPALQPAAHVQSTCISLQQVSWISTASSLRLSHYPRGAHQGRRLPRFRTSAWLQPCSRASLHAKPRREQVKFSPTVCGRWSSV